MQVNMILNFLRACPNVLVKGHLLVGPSASTTRRYGHAAPVTPSSSPGSSTSTTTTATTTSTAATATTTTLPGLGHIALDGPAAHLLSLHGINRLVCLCRSCECDEGETSSWVVSVCDCAMLAKRLVEIICRSLLRDVVDEQLGSLHLLSTATTTAATSSSSTASSSWCALAALRLGHAHVDKDSTHLLVVQSFHGCGCLRSFREGDERKSFPRVVSVCHCSVSFKGCLEVGVVDLLCDSVDKELAAVSCLLTLAPRPWRRLLAFRPCNIHLNCVAANLSVVHALDASLGLVVGAECDEGK